MDGPLLRKEKRACHDKARGKPNRQDPHTYVDYTGMRIKSQGDLSTDSNSNDVSLVQLNKRVIACTRCPRLRHHCETIAREKRAAFRDWEYWGKPVPGFGDPNAELLLIGLAPGAHGSNRTGRMFTGDGSGEFLYAALHRAGYANRAKAVHREDGLELKNCYITAVARCAPPGNRPTPKELHNCRPYLKEELRLLKSVRSVLALGKIAFDEYLDLLKEDGHLLSRAAFHFKHGAVYDFAPPLPRLYASYHPSRQNTQTGRLTTKMFDFVLSQISKDVGAKG